MKIFSKVFRSRLREPSTWAGIGTAALVGLLGVDPKMAQVVASGLSEAIQNPGSWPQFLAVGLPLVLSIVLPEKKGSIENK